MRYFRESDPTRNKIIKSKNNKISKNITKLFEHRQFFLLKFNVSSKIHENLDFYRNVDFHGNPKIFKSRSDPIRQHLRITLAYLYGLTDPAQ